MGPGEGLGFGVVTSTELIARLCEYCRKTSLFEVSSVSIVQYCGADGNLL